MDEITSPSPKKLVDGVVGMPSKLYKKYSRCHLTQFLCFPANVGSCTLSLKQPLQEVPSHSNHNSLQLIWKIEYQAIKGKYATENKVYMNKKK